MKFLIFFGMLITSMLLFPGLYSIVTEYVSNLGNPLFNPYGWYFFSIAFIFLSLAFIPCVLYLHKKLTQIYKLGTNIGTAFNLIASLGMFILALFPNLDITMGQHALGAGLSFGGMVTGAIIYWYIMSKDAIRKAVRNREFLVLIILVSIIALFALVLIIGLIQIIDLTLMSYTSAIFLPVPFWEWMLLFTIAFHTVIIGLIVPEKVQVLK